jgi:hypothetical protein
MGSPDRHRQRETARPRTSRIEEQHSRPGLDRRLMGVPEHHCRESRFGRIKVELRYVVQDKEPERSDFDQLRRRKRRDPVPVVDVAAHRKGGRNFRKPVDYLRFADVSCMDDDVRAHKLGYRLRPSSPWVSEMRPTRASVAGMTLQFLAL